MFVNNITRHHVICPAFFYSHGICWTSIAAVQRLRDKMRASRLATIFHYTREGNALAILVNAHPSVQDTSQPIGFIGVGNMGGPMAANLLSRGKNLIVFDVVASSVEQLVGAGAVKAGSPAEVARQTNLIVTMLPSHVQVQEVYEGKGGIFR